MATIDDLGARIDALELRIGAAESVLAIQGLKARYGELVDARFSRGGALGPNRMEEQAVRAAALFTEDGIWDGGPGLGVAQGRAEIAARLARPTLIFSRHLFVKPRIKVDGDRATGRWDLLCPCMNPAGESLWMSGYEDDTYARIDGEWLHASMTLTTVFVAPVGAGWPEILV